MTETRNVDKLFKQMSDIEKGINLGEVECILASGQQVTGDLHMKYAKAIFGLEEQEVMPKHRNFAKSKNFMFIYSAVGFDEMPPPPEEPTHCKHCLMPLQESMCDGCGVGHSIKDKIVFNGTVTGRILK